MMYKIRCTQCTLYMVLSGALPDPYVLVRVTRGAVIAHRCTYSPPRCRTSQYHRTFILLSVSVWNHLGNPVFAGVELACFKSRPMLFNWPSCSLFFCLLYCFPIFNNNNSIALCSDFMHQKLFSHGYSYKDDIIDTLITHLFI